MGQLNPHALYLNLLQDLSEHLSGHQYDELLSTGKTDWYPDSPRRQVASVQLANSFLKKFGRRGRTSAEADNACLTTFTSVNIACDNWSYEPLNSGEEELLGLVKNEIYKFWNPQGFPLVSSFEEIVDLGRAGPGASLLADGQDFYTKHFASRLSVTHRALYDIYVKRVSANSSWADAEINREAEFGEAVLVPGNRLAFVPKNVDTSRSTCTEPSVNMFLQLGLGQALGARLQRAYGIDLRTQQSFNRDMARSGSLEEGQRSLVTIDLSSASDSLSMKMMREMLPADFMSYLEALRSPSTTLPDGSQMALNMVSTMGNGFTFPLQTMLFACIVRAVASYDQIRLVTRPITTRDKEVIPPNFGVFGDDIICEARLAARVMRVLELLGFVVNRAKSFTDRKGPFRESCGGDYYNGHPVRGVYLKDLSTVQDTYIAINQLNKWSAEQGILLRRAVSSLRLSLGKRELLVPVWEDEDAGTRVTSYNLSRRKYSKGGSLLYRKWTARARKLRIEDGWISVPKGEKKRCYNSSGLLLAALRGDVRQACITVRGRTTFYTLRKGCIAPNWDTPAPEFGYSHFPVLAESNVMLDKTKLQAYGFAVEGNK